MHKRWVRRLLRKGQELCRKVKGEEAFLEGVESIVFALSPSLCLNVVAWKLPVLVEARIILPPKCAFVFRSLELMYMDGKSSFHYDDAID